MIDFHSHILPGIDDGSANMEESLAMARQAVASGTTHIVVTPHGSSSDVARMLEARTTAMSELQAQLEAEKIPLVLVPGLEYYADGHSAEIDLVPLEARCGLAPLSERPLLVELPMSIDVSFAENLLFKAQLADMPIVLAHPGRYKDFRKHLDMFVRLMERGMYLQFNAQSFLGGLFTSGLAKDIVELIRKNPENVLLGSDAHDSQHRPADMTCAKKRIVSMLGEDAWNLVTEKNARKLLGL